MTSIDTAKVEVVAAGGSATFGAGPGERLLYAGLRAGVELPYECASGTCGQCRARVLEGAARDLWPQAPAAGLLKRERGEILLCQSAACGDIRLQLRRAPAICPPGSAPVAVGGEIVRVRRLTSEVMEIVVRPTQPMRFAPGQFVLMQVPGIEGYRAYSMANDDDPAPTLVFVLRRKAGGGVSEWLFDADRLGSRVDLFGPLGRAVFEPRTMQDVVCIAGGSGIAGMMSIARRAVTDAGRSGHQTEIFFGVRNPAQLFYAQELCDLAKRANGRLRVRVAFSDGEPPPAMEAAYPGLAFDAGWVHEVALREMRCAPQTTTVFLAGPPVAVDAGIRALLTVAKFPLESIRFDRYG